MVRSGFIDKLLSRRNQFPAFVNRAVDYIADHPSSFLGRLAARRMGRPDAQGGTAVAAAESGRELRVLVGPVNYSGQGRLWAGALERADTRIRAVNMAIDVPGGFSFPADLVVPVAVYHNGEEWQRRQLAAAREFSHILIEAEEPLFGRLFDRDVARESSLLTESGVNVAYMCHGTDIRLPSLHRDRTRWSPYLDARLYTDRLERLARRNIGLVNNSGRPVFVSTPDLLADVPSALWCPVVVDPAIWASHEEPVSDGRPLRVAHTPSSAVMKGTQLIEPVLRSLHDRGVIEYRPVTGVPSAQMPGVLHEADVVLDQFRLGSYGVAACEAMAAGRLVIGHVLDTVRAEVQRSAGCSLPVVEATPDTLGAVLEKIAENRESLRTARRDGIAFVNAVHDGRLSARILIDNWISPSVQPSNS